MIRQMLQTKSIWLVLAFLTNGTGVGIVLAAGPSFDCSKVQKGSIEELICQDDALSVLDHKMAEVYAAAAKKAKNEHPPVLKAEQRGWIKGRNECWKSADQRQCIEESYKRRIAELQARYRLVPEDGPYWYACDGDPRVEYRAASDLAARGSVPLDIVLKVVGEFEGATQQIIQVNEGSEAPSASRIAVLRDGLLDDSVRGVRWDIALEKTTAGVWRIKEVKQAWRCWRGEQPDRFATASCP